MGILTTVLAFLLALGILIIIHELGHYAVARAFGVKVLRFSVGFGRPVLRRQAGPDATEWVVSAVPYGGYVKMLDENDPDCQPVAPLDLPHAFNRQSVARRAAIVVAGPVANLVLAVFLYWLIGVGGVLEPPAIVGPPPAHTAASDAGLQEGDRVLGFDGHAVRSWNELRWSLLRAALEGATVHLEVENLEGARRELTLDLHEAADHDLDEGWFERVGVVRGAGAARVRGLLPDGAAAHAGLAVDDLIVAIDGRPVRAASQVSETVRGGGGRAQEWEIVRGTRRLQRTLAAQQRALPDGKQAWLVGIDFLELETVRYGPLEALERAAGRTWDTSLFSLRMVGRMLEGRSSWRNLSGPVSIADVAGQTARIGVAAYLSFLALVSISLGVLNLLPIPVLDGGHLLYYAVELLKGSPPSTRVVEAAQRVGVGVLILLTALALYNDLTRLLS